MVDSPTENINIQLGDIVDLIAPDNEQLHLQQFYIEYIDPTKILLVNTESKQLVQLDIKDGELSDESVIQINLLSRADAPGYARQHNLVPGIWVDIYIQTNGEPLKITGLIMALEEDTVDIKTYPEEDIIYLDFAYQGLPQDPPIEKIIIRKEPLTESNIPDLADKEELNIPKSAEQLSSISSSTSISPDIIQLQVQQALMEGNQIILGDDLEEIEQLVDVPENERRFSLEKQTDDLLDELLSNIPTQKRTNAALNNIHTMIERYTQLRKAYSNFDKNGNANIPEHISENHKPLIQPLANLELNLSWILPVSINRKKIYDLDDRVAADTGSTSIVDVKLANVISAEETDMELYKTGHQSADENNYVNLFRTLNEYFTPFDPPLNPENSIISKNVSTNILSVVNNLDEMMSIVAGKNSESLEKKKFLLETYTRGLTYLQNASPTDLTSSDLLTIKSILVLTIPELLFSRLTCPTTKILTKMELDSAHLLYWQILNKNTEIGQTLTIDSLTGSKEKSGYDSDTSDIDRVSRFRKTLLSNTREYILDESLYKDSNSPKTFELFLDQIIPTNEECFNILKKYIKNPLSVHSIVQFLEVFNIYHNDLTSNQYSKITNFVRYNIASYKSSFAANLSTYTKLAAKKPVLQQPSKWLKILSTHKSLNTIVLDAYGLTSDYTDSEIFTRIFSIDYGKLFTIALIRIDLDLQSTGLIKDFVDKYEESINAKRLLTNTCKTISKRYTSLENLATDNNSEIYVDSEFDKTNYLFIEKYKSDQDTLPADQFKTLLKTKLLENKDLSPQNAEREANAILLKKRIVENGDYAIVVLPKTESSEPITQYFLRKDNSWVPATDLIGNVEIKDNQLLCDLQEDCISIEGKCKTFKQTESIIDENTLKSIYKEFDDTYGDSEADIRQNIDKILEQNISRIQLLRQSKTARFYKYNKMMQDLGQTFDDAIELTKTSPHENLRELILGQGDFIKKQHYIQRFSLLFTRKPYATENQYWLYCIKTDVKLLPTFLSHLANVIISKGDYLYELDVVATNQGTISDDGDAYVDKYSGYFIKRIDFDTEEGFTEEGFKLKTREKLEQDLGDAVLELDIAPKPSGIIETEEAKIIINIINAITGINGMGINIESDKNFIINNVLLLHKKIAPNKQQYERRTKKLETEGKRITSYEDEIGRPLIILIFVFIAIAIQTNIPGIEINKTFPTCIKSFKGFPISGDDLSPLTYIACIARKMRSSEYPWNSIKQLKEEKLVLQMKNTIDTYKIIATPAVRLKIDEMRIFNKTKRKDITFDIEHLETLHGFLPPLIPFTVKAYPFVAGFSELLAKNIRNGSSLQQEQIAIIKSKMLTFGLSIQQSIQKIINKKDPLITTRAEHPFLENACCNSESTNITQYFIDIDNSIGINNQIVSSYDDIRDDIFAASTAPLFFDPTDTKYKYPDIGGNFSPDTIYRAFVVFCKHKQLALSENLREVCGLSPELPFIEETTDQRIDRLKESGINYDEELLQKLLSIVNTKNRVYINLSVDAPNILQLFTDKLNTLAATPENPVIPSFLVDKLLQLIDTYSLKQDSLAESRALKNYLDTQNSALSDTIKLYVRSNASLSKTRFTNFVECLDNITSFLEIGDDIYVAKKDESVFKMMFFVKNTLRNLIDVFPNIITNKVNYLDVTIPKHWNLSQRHVTDLKEIVSGYYKNLKPFYSEPDLDTILINIQLKCKDIMELALVTPYFTSFNNGTEVVNSIFDERLITLLFKNYLLTTINEYINLSYISQAPTLPEDVLAIGEVAQFQPVDDDDEASYIAQATIAGVKKEIMNKVSLYLVATTQIVCTDKININYNKESIMGKILVAREKEKDTITEYLGNLSDEEREVENLFKKHKLEKWSKGLQKGLTQYVRDDYDEERENIDKQLIREKELSKHSGVTNQNSNIYSDEIDDELRRADEIDNEEYSLEGFGGEDDNSDNDDN
jgi:hypothetical protein